MHFIDQAVRMIDVVQLSNYAAEILFIKII